MYPSGILNIDSRAMYRRGSRALAENANHKWRGRCLTTVAVAASILRCTPCLIAVAIFRVNIGCSGGAFMKSIPEDWYTAVDVGAG